MARGKKTVKPPSKVSFNHAMIYSRNVPASLHFYRDLLGFRLIEKWDHDGHLVYARLRASQGGGTIALHQAESRRRSVADGEIRLYFEVASLKRYCQQLRAAGVRFSQLPKKMPWGWTHAYLNDPDGHEVSLYWAGKLRFQPS